MPVANPRRNNPRLAGEHVGKPRHLALVQQIAVRDPKCLLHIPDPFGSRGLFPDGRALDDLDFADLDSLCTCLREQMGDGVRKPKPVKEVKKVCPKCRIRKSRLGTCFCD